MAPAPLWEQALIFVLAPPIMASLIRVMSRGWANVVQGGQVSETTVRRQRREFWSVLAVMYVGLFCIFLYGYIKR